MTTTPLLLLLAAAGADGLLTGASLGQSIKQLPAPVFGQLRNTRASTGLGRSTSPPPCAATPATLPGPTTLGIALG